MGKSSCQRIGESQQHRGAESRCGATSPWDDLATTGTPSNVTRLPGGVAFRWETTGAGVLILAALGCASIPSIDQHLSDMAQLQAITPAGLPVGYRGSDQQYHYFLLQDGGNVALPRDGWHVTNMPVTLGWCIPLVFDRDRLVIPSSEWSSRIDLNSLQWALRE